VLFDVGETIVKGSYPNVFDGILKLFKIGVALLTVNEAYVVVEL
jgi:hypothetical protein